MDRSDLLLQIYNQPHLVKTLTLTEWDLLIRQARGCNMLARLEWLLERDGLKQDIPLAAAKHLDSACNLALGHERSVRWEVNRICRAFSSLNIPVVLLKGAAYQALGLELGKGRIFNDIDLLVPKESLKNIERTLLLHGWTTTHHDPYDQKYFREWMHEIPPLRHIHRHSVLDVHHTILPVTAQLRPDVNNIFSAIQPINDNSQVYTLSPVDMVLHSAAHLFHEGEFEHGFRGLCDLDGLFRYYSSTSEEFWSDLNNRAVELDLVKPLLYALAYSKALLNTPIPDAVLGEIRSLGGCRIFQKFMQALYLRALRPYHHSCDTLFSATSRWLLYIRSHYIKMPFYLLLPHLFHKAFLSGKTT